MICRLPSLYVWDQAERTQRPASTGTVNRSMGMWPSPVTGVSHSVAAGSDTEHQRRDVQKASLLRKPGGSCMACQAQPRKSPSPRHITGCKHVTVASLHSRAGKWDSASWWGLACGMRDVVVAIFGKCSLPQGTSLQQPSTTWVGKIPRRRACNPLQHSCLENPMDRGAWQATVHEVTKSQTGLSDQAHTYHQRNGAVIEGCSPLTAPLPQQQWCWCQRALWGQVQSDSILRPAPESPKASFKFAVRMWAEHRPWWQLQMPQLLSALGLSGYAMSLTGWGFVSFSNLWATS